MTAAMEMLILHTWNGKPLESDECIRVIMEAMPEADYFDVTIKAKFYGQEAPAQPPGSCPGLWDSEVVELFILGHDDHYLELEFGPHKHYLVLQFEGYHRCTKEGLHITYETAINHEESWWEGRARIPKTYLPPAGPRGMGFRINAYAIHTGGGAAGERQYYALHTATNGEQGPDFHRLAYFQPMDASLAQNLIPEETAGASREKNRKRYCLTRS